MQHRRRLTRAAALVALALVALTLTAVPGHATFAKKYDLTITPPSIAAGGTQVFAATFKNKSLYKIGSTELTVPPGFQVSGATTTRGTIVSAPTSTTVKIKDLKLSYGSSFTVSVTASAPCGTSTGSWSAVTKTGNFSGSLFSLNNPGDAQKTTVSGSCSLAFVVQPTDTAVGGIINAPDGVAVRALDGASQPVAGVAVAMAANGPGSLSGTSPVATAGDPATAAFTDLSLDQPGTYTLTASAPGFGTADSVEFDVAGEVLECGDTYPDGSIVNEPGPDAANDVNLSRQNGACDQGIAVTVFIRATEVEIQKPFVDGSAFTMSIDWVEEEASYPVTATQIDYDDDEQGFHPMQPCGPEVGGQPTLPAGEFWCVTGQSFTVLPSGKVQVSESYFGSGDPRVTRG
ncbi:MAG TPA: hypothetical protein VG993_06765 [Actinomycetota bacterium]|nr:hypothetical protein [Actinomycetota bacterium]